MQDADGARQQAERDHNSNQGPANTNAWDGNARQVYEAERTRLQKQQEEQNNQKKGW